MNTLAPVKSVQSVPWPQKRGITMTGMGTFIHLKEGDLQFIVVARDNEALIKALEKLLGPCPIDPARNYQCQLFSPAQ